MTQGKHSVTTKRLVATLGLALACAILASVPAAAQEKQGRLDVYGFAMLDMGYESGQSDPDWFDVMRPTKLPSFDDEFGGDGETYAGVRQSRFGVKGFT